MDERKTFLGTGWSFPPTFDKKSASVKMVADDEDIRQSLRIILFTAYRERTMRPEFGSGLLDSIFDSIDEVAVTILTDKIRQAIVEFEPRITLHGVTIVTEDIYDGKLNINLDYTIRIVNVRNNVVFPFYFKEGTNVPDK